LTQNKSIWLKTEEIPGPFKLEGGELMEMTQKKAYKMILRHRKRLPGNNPTDRRMESTRKELLQKTGTCMTTCEIWINNEKGVMG